MSDNKQGEGLSPEMLANLKDADLLGRLKKNITRDLAISYNQSVVAFLCRLLAERDPVFLQHLQAFSTTWTSHIADSATQRSKTFAHVPSLSEHLPEEMQRKLAQDYVTAHVEAANTITQQFIRTATPDPKGPDVPVT